MNILKGSRQAEYFTTERCYILELFNRPDDPAVSIAWARVELGMTTNRHRVIGTDERYVVLQGTGMLSIAMSEPQLVKPGDVAKIPGGAEQRIANVGDDDLIFLCVCTPRFEWRNYQLLE